MLYIICELVWELNNYQPSTAEEPQAGLEQGKTLHHLGDANDPMVQRIVDNFMNSFRRRSGRDSANGILSREAFSRILQRERERTDRSGQGFALVVFDFGDGVVHANVVQSLIDRLLLRSVRMTDEVGWFQEKSIGALLACTSADGAWKFANDVLDGIAAKTKAPNCQVYTYPADADGGAGRSDREREVVAAGACRGDVLTSGRARAAELEPLMGGPIPLGKRAFDVLVALLAIVLLSPVFLLIAVFIKLVSPGPVFFRQERIGYRRRPFTLWKFRSMHVNNSDGVHVRHITDAIERDAPITKLDDLTDKRIIPFGNLLRRSCLDELPQLWNVLRGEMSLIGPRPCLQFEAERLLPWQRRRFDTLPGMSGLWQISGKNRTTFKEMTRFDIRYSQKLSPGLDAKILFCTVPSILGMVFEVPPGQTRVKAARIDTLPIDVSF